MPRAAGVSTFDLILCCTPHAWLPGKPPKSQRHRSGTPLRSSVRSASNTQDRPTVFMRPDTTMSMSSSCPTPLQISMYSLSCLALGSATAVQSSAKYG